ncbi:hypothetical protein R9C00_24015 [Flammeovirgaceae bacterium SG7u.111]|nr:hypothetical protein [Flammeovirgaceae bacterium SG7u.132]WPO34769.1 hypothetical protein R9C00_24015 [Flammeovirgaceae bacterium SG7u.111]
MDSIKKYLPALGVTLSVVIYVKLGYFHQRSDFGAMMVLFSLLFALTFALYRSSLSTKKLIYVGVFFRLLLLFVLPNLSDDYFRFLWDGRLSLAGMNPYVYLPSELMGSNISVQGIDASLFSQLNSPEYFTIYPPVLQGVFFIGAVASPLGDLLPGVVAMRLTIVLAEIATLWVIPKLLQVVGQPQRNILFYALNPLVVVELVGNLHFEALMICFLLFALYFIQKEKILLSAVFMALSITAKLVPLMFLPLFFFYLGWKKSIKFYFITGFFTLLAFLPFLSVELVEHIGNSVDLYFRKFEFNASIYYVVRWIGYHVRGYNIIQTAGPRLSLATLVFILVLMVNQRNSFKDLLLKMLLSLSVYFFLATIVHPWYVTGVMLLCVFTQFRFGLMWSFLALFSYAAYRSSSYAENLWLVGAEYIIVYAWLCYEVVVYLNIGKEKAEIVSFFMRIWGKIRHNRLFE